MVAYTGGMERLILFAKTPRLHEVKTRLAGVVTPERALELHRAMVRDQLAFVRSLRRADRSCEVCLDRPPSPGDGLADAIDDLPRTAQGEGGLGDRMHRALARAFEEGASRAAILGADAPTLPGERVEAAFAALRGGADAVIVPAADGGYVLIGASRAVPPLFETIPWGTSTVAEATRLAALRAGLVLAETDSWSDVDVEGDLVRLSRELAADPNRAPETAAAIARIGLYAARKPVL
jgi:rSAM/selenodomain-associated transferase 1